MKLADILFEEISEPEYREEIDPEMQDQSKNLFIRFGPIHGASKVGLGPEWKQETGKNLEAGTSVYFVKKIGTQFWDIEPVKRYRASYQIPSEYFRQMLSDNFMPAIANDEVYILKGKLIPRVIEEFDDAREENVRYTTYETGSDGEPLIDPYDYQIVKTLTTEEVLDKVSYDGSKVIGDLSYWPYKQFRERVWDYVREEEPNEEHNNMER
jgi:hypothetical protein